MKGLIMITLLLGVIRASFDLTRSENMLESLGVLTIMVMFVTSIYFVYTL